MAQPISRRKMLHTSAGVTVGAFLGSGWKFVVDPEGRIATAAANETEAHWAPLFLSKKQSEQVAAICEAIIPRTDTAGARDARVHEFIDLALSLEQAISQKRFTEGLAWMDKRCKKENGKSLHKASDEGLTTLLEPLSDAHTSRPDELAPGAGFFRDIKNRTILGYYTSKVGRVEALGLPPEVRMEEFKGCTHPASTH